MLQFPYKAGETVPPEKVFICKECKRVILDPVKNRNWDFGKTHGCGNAVGGCGELDVMVCITEYSGGKLQHCMGTPNGNYVTHSDVFSVTSNGDVFLEGDMTRKGRKSLTDHINERLDIEMISDDLLVAALKRKNPEEMSRILSSVYKQ